MKLQNCNMQNSMKHLDSVTSFHQKILSAWSSSFYPFLFIVFSRMLRNSTPRFVHPSVDQSDPFLVADTQLYKRLCLSVCWLVGLSVTIESKSEKTRISAPAHPSATDGRVSGLVTQQKPKVRCSFFLILIPPWPFYSRIRDSIRSFVRPSVHPPDHPSIYPSMMLG